MFKDYCDVKIDFRVAESLITLCECGATTISKDRCLAELRRGLKAALNETIADKKARDDYNPESED